MTSTLRSAALAVAAVLLWLAPLIAACVDAADPQSARPGARPRVLFLTQSAGFVHDVVRRAAPDAPARAEVGLSAAAQGRFDLILSQDASALDAAALASFDAVVFYTTGELPLPDPGALIDWVADGGAFVGLHCATDTFYEFAPYLAMVGGEFDGHPWHQQVDIRVEDRRHPATAHLGSSWTHTDEIYQFRDFARHPTRVLLALDNASVDAARGKRGDGDYALAWTRDFGRGRVFYSALGHRPEAWSDPAFLEHVLGGLAWALDGPDLAALPPANARVLIDADGAPERDAWTHRGGGDFAWTPVDGAVEVAAGAGDLVTRGQFGSGLWHVEFRTPPTGDDVTGQAKGNSGVYVQGRYEVQVLDSFGIASGLGDCGAIYGQKVPDRNASRQSGRWQAYDIRFTVPRLDATGATLAPARMSVWHNGVLVHDDVALDGPTGGALSAEEVPRGPLLLQDHGDAVRYRSVWFVPDAPEAPATSDASEGEASWRDEVQAWQRQREASLRSPTGYLALAGLEWIEPGLSTIGSASDSDVALPEGRAAEDVGIFERVGDKVGFTAAPRARVFHEGEPVASLALASDADGAPTRLTTGELTFWVIVRGAQVGIRLRDPQSPVLAAYTGTERFPIDAEWRVEGSFVAYDVPRPMVVPNILGTTFAESSPGVLQFEHDGTSYRLRVSGDVEDGFFAIFGDATNGKATYGAGRFLAVDPPDADGRVVLDFNRAYNPPCAYSPYTTCPLPPEGNVLPFAVEAGEKAPVGMH